MWLAAWIHVASHISKCLAVLVNTLLKTRLYPEFFRREDERPDHLFYQQPRLYVDHIDENARKMVTGCYGEILPERGHILDLMASWDSHLPPRFDQVTGLGLNRQELEHNSSLSNCVIFDVNRGEQLPFVDNTFDGVVCTVSVQYMTRPTETFFEIGRSLKKGAPFIVAFSNRMFPSKAVLVWRASDDQCHIRLVKHYFSQTQAFGQVSMQAFEPQSGDPLYVLWACKQT